MKNPCNLRPKHAGTLAGAVAALFATSYASSLFANPTGAQVVSGTVNIKSPNAGQMTITQTTPKAIVNWNTFSIGSNEAVSIAQPSAAAALLNRVMGNDPSIIAGRLQSNGKVFLVNPAGVIFAPGSSVNVGSLIASTLNISNADFLAGNYHFVGTSATPVSNAGSLTAGSGGTIALLGGSVSNTGTVIARLGAVAVGAGNDITLDFAGDGLTALKINQGAANALIGNTGTLAADGGTVIMSAQTADALAGTVINQQGIVRAQSLTERNGHIVLDGGTNGVTQVSGTLDATGAAGLTGGQIDVTGHNVALLDGARADASGAVGGGAVHFGGGAAGADPAIRDANAIWMAPAASLHADALANGNGGNVVAFSETASRIYGTLSAKGGPQGGNGGQIETSGHYLDTAGATIDAPAPNGNGGTWKLDPDDIDIVSFLPELGTPATETNGSPTMFTPAGALSYVVNTLITDQLKKGISVTITTASDPQGGDINIQAPINASTPTNPTNIPTLTFSAAGSITDSGQSIMASGGPLNLVFDANVGNSTSGHLIAINGTSASPVNLTTNGGDVTMGVIAGQAGSFDGAAVELGYTNINTLANGLPSGSVTIHGQTKGAADPYATDLYAVELLSSQITTSTGSIELEGNLGTGTVVPVGGVFLDTAVIPTPGIKPTQALSSLQTTSGAIRIYGIGIDPTGNSSADIAGVRILAGSSVQSTTGPIDIRGAVLGSTSNVFRNYGVELGYSTISSPAISVTGSTNTAAPGILLSSTLNSQESGGPTIDAGKQGSIVLRALNNGKSDSIQFVGKNPSVKSAGGTLVMLPGGVDTTSQSSPFSITNSDGTPINLYSSGPGLSIDSAAVGMLSGFQNVILGSTTQTGLVTVNRNAPSQPNFFTNLTLAAAGTGSQGIALPYGILMTSDNTLTLSSAGPVTEGGGIIATLLFLDGPGTFTLKNAQNQVFRLAMIGVGDVNFLNYTGLYIGLPGGNLAPKTFNSGTNQVTTIYGTKATLTGNLTVQSTIGSLTVDGPIEKNAGGDATLTLSAAYWVELIESTIKSTAGKLNLVFNSNLNGFGLGDVDISSSALSTNGGNLTIGVPQTLAGTQYGAAVLLRGSTIDTTGSAPNGSIDGSVTIYGRSTSAAPSVYLYNSGITTSTGSIDVQGEMGTAAAVGGYGGVLMDSGAGLKTDSGAIRIVGAATVPAGVKGSTPSGVAIHNTSVETNSGSIDIRGAYESVTHNTSDGTGVDIEGSKIATLGAGTSVSIAGSTDLSYSGVRIGNASSVSAGSRGTIVLRAMNDNSNNSLSIAGSSVSSNGGVLAVFPGGVDPNTFAFISGDTLPIGLFSTVAGMSVDATTFGAFSGFNTIAIGSPTQTGRITVGGAGCSSAGPCTQEPTFHVNLTFANPAPGSQGIDLLYGASMLGYSLTLVSAGPVIDPGGIQAASLLLSGPGSFTLTDPQNAIGVLSMVGAGNVNFLNSGKFVIGAVVSQIYNPSTNQSTTIDGTNSTLTGNLVAQAATGNIALKSSLSAGGTVDMVMENGVFNAGSAGPLSATNGWRIWASTWNQEVRGNVQPNTLQPNFYGCAFSSGCSWGGTVPTTGDHYVYLQRPTVTVTVTVTPDGKTRYVFAPNPTFTYTVSGLINGDTQAGALTGSLTSPPTQNSPAGRYSIDANYVSPVGYIVDEVPATLTVEPIPTPVAQSGLQTFFTNQEQSFVYENNLQGTNICIGSNQPLFTTTPAGNTQDLLAVEWKRVRSQPNLNSCVLLNGQHGCGDF